MIMKNKKEKQKCICVCVCISFDFTDEIYLGSENPLLLKQRATIEVTCEFDLSFYPFDTQRCLIVRKNTL